VRGLGPRQARSGPGHQPVGGGPGVAGVGLRSAACAATRFSYSRHLRAGRRRIPLDGQRRPGQAGRRRWRRYRLQRHPGLPRRRLHRPPQGRRAEPLPPTTSSASPPWAGSEWQRSPASGRCRLAWRCRGRPGGTSVRDDHLGSSAARVPCAASRGRFCGVRARTAGLLGHGRRGAVRRHGAQDRPDAVRLSHHRGSGLHPRRDHPARRSGQEAQKEAVQGRVWHLAYHLAGRGQARLPAGAARLLVGTGQDDTVVLSEEATAYFERNRCQVELLPTPEVIPVWNQAEGAVIGLFQVTC
jgi:hypothetical protein